MFLKCQVTTIFGLSNPCSKISTSVVLIADDYSFKGRCNAVHESHNTRKYIEILMHTVRMPACAAPYKRKYNLALKVSICIPAYKQPDYLRRTLQSVVMQDYDDYEVMITDDSPDDSVAEVVAEFDHDARIAYHRNRERKGAPENWNEAMRRASGEYIKILHHDDWFTRKDSLQNFVNLLEKNSSADFAFCSTYQCDAYQRVLHLHHPTDTQLAALRKDSLVLYNGNFIGSPSTTIFRRSSDCYFDRNLKWVVDIDFYIEMLKRNSPFSYSSTPFIYTTSGAEHQVTAVCAGNRDVELYEWIYLYSKLCNKYGLNMKMLKSVKYLIRRYNVTSVSELKQLGLKMPIPLSIKVLIALQKTKQFCI